MKIGLISGCFDLIHEGHRHILTQARNYCNYLVVCINSDEYIKRKKNREPLMTATERQRLILERGLADECVIIEDSPLEVIKMLRPSVILVGSDYTKENTVGSKECLAWDGEIVIVPRIPNISTSEIIKQTK